MRRAKVIDRSAKILLKVALPALLQLAGHDVVSKPIHEQNVSVNLPERQADLVYQVGDDFDPDRWAAHFEVQYRPDRSLLPGWFLKCAALNAQLEIPVLLVVLYLKRGHYATFPDHLVLQGGPFSNTFQFETIRLWEHTERIRSGELAVLAPLLVLCEDHPTEKVLEEERRLIHALPATAAERADLLSVALSVATAFFSRDRLREIFWKEIPMIRQASLVDEWMQEARTQARQEDLRALLERKFGPVPEELGARINRIQNAARLRSLMLRIIDASTLEEVGI